MDHSIETTSGLITLEGIDPFELFKLTVSLKFTIKLSCTHQKQRPLPAMVLHDVSNFLTGVTLISSACTSFKRVLKGYVYNIEQELYSRAFSRT